MLTDTVPPTRALSPRRKVAYAWVACVLMFGALEFACRLIEPVDSRFYRLQPKLPGVLRIVTLGGSTVFGTPVRELGIMAQLDATLRHALDRDFEVINLGTPAAGSTFVLGQLELAIADGDPDLLVVLTAHNEFLDRTAEATPVRSWLLERLALLRGLESVTRSKPAPRSDAEILPDRLEPYDRASPWFSRVRDRYRENLDRIAAIARAADIPLVLCTAPRNLVDWAPSREEGIAKRGDSEVSTRIESHLEAGRHEQARRALDGLGEGDDATRAFFEGRIFAATGDAIAAKRALERASDADPFPWRTLREFNTAIRDRAGPGVRVVDVAKTLEDASPDGLVGWDLIYDNCHPTPHGAAIAARSIASTILELLGENPNRLDAPDAALTRYRADLGERWNELETEGWFRTGVYVMKVPFFAYARARHCFRAALERNPKCWAAWANLGTMAILEGAKDEGVSCLSRATEIKGAPLTLEDTFDVPYLRVAARRADIDLARL